MSLSAGTRLGVYEVLGSLGAGGMGEVYRARDTRLGRDVAIKVLPEAFSTDPERLARFEREARTLALLNHPHIAHVHGLEESSGVRALVMELVEGEDLAHRIAHGPVPLDEAVAIARQIAEALEAAHDAGIIHRDLKPANIKVRPDGTAKVLDFGLAKALESTAGVSGVANSPTLTSPAMTQAGVILGTAAYMAPEQAKGKAVDKRVDIWAFGCVLYEMLSGRHAFGGEDITDTLTSIMRDPPDWARLPLETPAAVRNLLRRCLEKNPTLRLRDIGEARVALIDPAAEPAEPVSPPRTRGRTVALVASASAIGGLVVGLAGLAWWRPAPAPANPVVRFSLPMLPSAPLFRGAGGAVIFSRDGQTLVYVVRPEGQSRSELRLRRLDAEHDEPIRGTEGGFAPFLSPDGQWVGFIADQKVKKVAIAGGPPTTICDQGRFSRAVWADDHTILLGTSQSAPDGGTLARVSDAGGVPTDFTKLAEHERFHQLPQLLPDRRHFLFTTIGSAGSQVGLGSLATGEHRVLFEGSFATWLPPDRILFAKHTDLFVVPFDLARLSTSGTAQHVLEDATTLEFGGVVSVPLVAIDPEGSAAYAPLERGREGSLVRMDTNGRLTTLPVAPAPYSSPRLSPDGSRVAVSIGGDNRLTGSDIWVVDVVRGTRLRLTSRGGRFPTWSSNGREVTFSADSVSGADGRGLARVPADGSGALTRLSTAPSAQQLPMPAIGGNTIVFAQLVVVNGRFQSDLFHLADGKSPVAIVSTPADERSPAVSPDGKWLAYVSDASGRDEVYVKSYSSEGGTIPVSASGGFQPVWARDGRSLFYREGDRLMRAAFDAAPARVGSAAFVRDLPRETFGSSPYVADYDVAADGSLILIQRSAAIEGEELKVILNWSRTLNRSR